MVIIKREIQRTGKEIERLRILKIGIRVDEEEMRRLEKGIDETEKCLKKLQKELKIVEDHIEGLEGMAGDYGIL